MCGRFHLKTLPESFRERFPPDWEWSEIPHDLPPRYNIAPSSRCVVVREGEDTPTAAMQVWGFRPHWMKQKSKAQINARAERMFSSPMFKSSARRRRCVVVCDGFYEPKGAKGGSRPWYRFHLEDDEVFTMGGIWTSYSEGDEQYDSFAIVTTEPNAQVEPIHDRMPVLLADDERLGAWLDSGVSEDDVRALCQPRDMPALVAYRVSDAAKSPRNDGEECIEPA